MCARVCVCVIPVRTAGVCRGSAGTRGPHSATAAEGHFPSQTAHFLGDSSPHTHLTEVSGNSFNTTQRKKENHYSLYEEM